MIATHVTLHGRKLAVIYAKEQPMAREPMTLQERAVRTTLKQHFEPHIDLSDVIERHEEPQLQSFRTSRALAAFSAAANAHITIDEACKAVVDESGDEGIDAFAISYLKREVYLIQAKTGRGAPSPTEVQKFLNGIDFFLTADWEELGPKMQQWRETFESLIQDDIRVVAIFTTLSSKDIPQKTLGKINRFLNKTNRNGEILEFRYETLKDNFEHRTTTNPEGEIKTTLPFEQWLSLGDYQSEIVGIVNGEQLAQLAIEYGDRLFDKNIRSVLSNSATNEVLYDSIKQNPQEFWHYNNGITIVASSITSSKLSPQPGFQKFEITNISVVNGAQTVGSLARAKHDELDLDEVFVTVRIISTKQRDSDFENRVTRFTNTQNQIGGRDFVALDPRHQIWKEALFSEGVEYLYKSGSEGNDDSSIVLSFKLDDATRALACLSSIEDAALVKRNIGAFYSDLEKGPYKKVFGDTRTAEEVCNAVRFWFKFGTIYTELSKKRSNKNLTITKNAYFFCCSILMQVYTTDGNTFNDFNSDPSDWISNHEDLIDKIINYCTQYFEENEIEAQPAAFFKRSDVRQLRDYIFENKGLI